MSGKGECGKKRQREQPPFMHLPREGLGDFL